MHQFFALFVEVIMSLLPILRTIIDKISVGFFSGFLQNYPQMYFHSLNLILLIKELDRDFLPIDFIYQFGKDLNKILEVTVPIKKLNIYIDR